MKFFKLLLLFILLFSFTMFTVQCAGTRADEDIDAEQTGSDGQQEDLDDIEALLGITTDETEKGSNDRVAETQPKNEQLELLDTGEVSKDTESRSSNAYMAAAMADENAKKEKDELNRLKKDLKVKDQRIKSMESQLRSKDDQINQLSSQSSASYTSAPQGDVSPEQYENRYNEARNAFENKDYDNAIRYFETLLGSSTSNKLADNAQYWIGESYYGKRQYSAAIIAFEKVFTFPNSNKKDDAQLKLGLCYIRKGDKAKAREELNRLLTDYPNSEYAGKAERLLSRL